MDLLDQIILKNARRVTVTSYSAIAGNPSNSIEVEFVTAQDASILSSGLWSRVSHWMLAHRVLQSGHLVAIDAIPNGIDADEVAQWLSEELVKQGYSVLLKKWVASGQYVEKSF